MILLAPALVALIGIAGIGGGMLAWIKAGMTVVVAKP
jgi:hypothetical protein